MQHRVSIPNHTIRLSIPSIDVTMHVSSAPEAPLYILALVIVLTLLAEEMTTASPSLLAQHGTIAFLITSLSPDLR